MSEEIVQPVRASRFYRHAWIFYLLLAVAGLTGIAAGERQIDLALFIDRQSWWLDLAYGLGAGLALLGLWWLARRLFASARELEQILAALLAGTRRDELVAIALISALAEELLFRGAIQGALGLLPAAALFALVHVGPRRCFRLWSLFALTAGLGLGALVATRGNLGAAIVAHLVVNLVQLRRLGAMEPPPGTKRVG